MWQDKLKEAGVSIHVIATGGGAGIQQHLWEVPGSSAYLSGASFPYAQEEHEEMVGFKPEHYCSQEDAIDLASVAYMKAYRFGSKKPVGIGLTASVASEKVHRGEHRVFICVITDDKVWSYYFPFEKGAGFDKRIADGTACNNLAALALQCAFGLSILNTPHQDTTELARARFFAHPFFTADGKRQAAILDPKRQAIMAGAFNPPHQGHLGMAQACQDQYNHQVVYEITANTPHKGPLTVQELLKRAKLLQGHPRLFMENDAMYIDKARAFPGVPIVLGADAMLRILDPKWGLDVYATLDEFAKLGTVFYIAGREVDGKFITCDMLKKMIPTTSAYTHLFISHNMAPIEGRWDISSTEIRRTLQEVK
jgi:hypothetical protein